MPGARRGRLAAYAKSIEYLSVGPGGEGGPDDAFGGGAGSGGEVKLGAAGVQAGSYAITVSSLVSSIAGIVSSAKGAAGTDGTVPPTGGDAGNGNLHSGGDGATGELSSFDGTARYYGSGGGIFGATPGAENSLGNQGGGGNGPAGGGQLGREVIRYPTGSMTATGGTITTSGGWTIHTFTSNGTFTVS